VALNIRAANNDSGNINDKMIMGEMFVMTMTGRDAWDVIRAVNGMQGFGGTVLATWSESSFDIDKVSKGSTSCKVFVGAKLSEWLWDCRNHVLDHKAESVNMVMGLNWGKLPLNVTSYEQLEKSNRDQEWLVGMMKNCRVCGEMGHLSIDRYLFEYGDVDWIVECAECGSTHHTIRGCPRLGMYPLFSITTNEEIKEWKLLVDSECDRKLKNSYGNWDGRGGPREVYRKRSKEVKGLKTYEGKPGEEGSFMQKGRGPAHGDAECDRELKDSYGKWDGRGGHREVYRKRSNEVK
jgi:hypothetical protein